MMKKISRFELIGDTGRDIVIWEEGMLMSLQDDERTLKVFRKKPTELPNYKKGYQILSEYFDSISEEERIEVDKRLTEVGL